MFDFLLRCAAIQPDGEPLFLVHVVGRMKSFLGPEETPQNRVAFHIEHIHKAAAGKPQLLPPDFHHQAVPLAVVPVTQNGVGVGPGVVRFCAVFCFCVGEDLLAGHGVSCSRFNIFSKSKCFPPNSEARVSLIRSSNFSVNDSCCKFRKIYFPKCHL